MKIVINKCFGGFGLSTRAQNRVAELKGVETPMYDFELKRDDPHLVRAVEELGSKANGGFAKLKVVDVPDGVEYTIEEYDGMEHIAEAHRTWG